MILLYIPNLQYLIIIYLLSIMQNLSQSEPHCTYNKLAYHVCSNPNCTFNPFICQDSCQCEIHHRQCEKINWQYIKEKLNCSTVKKNPTFQSFSNNVESLYQNIIKQVTKAYEDFIEWKNNFGFTEKESQFLKLIEERRYNQITGSEIAIMTKQIRTPSKMIMKTQRQIKEKILMANTYGQSMLLQFSELYSKNKVVKVNIQKKNIENIDENENENNIEQINQNKINLVHRLLGLNEKGIKFLMMLNENNIEKKLEKLIQKVNQNEGEIKKVVNLKIEQLKQNIKDQKKQITDIQNEIKKEISQSKSDMKIEISEFRTEYKQKNDETKKQVTDMKKEAIQFRNENKIQYNDMKKQATDMKKEATQFRNENKIQYNDMKKQATDMKKEATQFRNENKIQYNDMKKQATDMKKEATQFRNENKIQYNDMKKQATDMKKEATQFRNENKIQYNDMKKQATDMKKEATQFRNENKIQYNDMKKQATDMKKEATQFRNENKIQYNDMKKQATDMKKEATQFRNENKIQYNDMKKQATDMKKEATQFRNENKIQYNDMKKQATDMKKEATQFRNENKIQYNDMKKQATDMKKEATQFRNENKIQYNDMKKQVTDIKKDSTQHTDWDIFQYGQILFEQIILKININNIKSMIISNIQLTSAIRQNKYSFFAQSLLKMQSSELLNKIQQKVPSLLKNHIENKLNAQQLHLQYISIQKQAELFQQQFDLMSKNFQSFKTNAISYLFSKKIAKLDLLYRASQNNFQVSKFHEKCDGKQHTITILKTQFGNIIGGYTPLAWDKNKNEEFQADNNMQSFIFSLTNKHKLTLIQGRKEKAIKHRNDWGPIFGGWDLYIYDKANQNTKSQCIPGNTYNYNNEYGNNQQSYKKWSGQSNGYGYKILQWQVYSILFA